MRARAVAVAVAALAPWAAPPAAAVTFTAPVVVTSDDVRDPGIDIAPDGTVYVAAVSSLPSPGTVYRSGGAGTWQETPPGMRAAMPGGLAFDLTVAPATGALATTDLWAGSATVARSTDRGQTWTAQPVQGEVAQDRPWVAAGGGNVVYHATHVAAAGIVVSRSADGGLTYGPRSVAATPADQQGCLCPSGNVVATAGGLVALLYPTVGGVRLARSTDGGLTFRSSVVRAASGYETHVSHPVLAAAGGGVLVATWTDVGAASSRVAVSVSADLGVTWSAPRYVVSTGTSLYPWVAASGSRIGISLYRTSAAGAPDTVPASAAWYASYVESTDGGATWSGVTAVDPTPVKTGPICVDGAGCAADRELGTFQSVAFDASGRPHIAYVRSVDGASNTELRHVRGT